MSLKFTTNKTYLENVNGSKNFGEFNIDYDSNRDKNKQVRASFNTNGKKYEVQDSMQKFMNNIPSNSNSIFDLLKNDLHESKKYNSTNHSVSSNYMKLKENVKGFKKSSKGKYKVNKGITSKLFDYNEDMLHNDTNHQTHKHIRKLRHKPRFVKKQTRKKK